MGNDNKNNQNPANLPENQLTAILGFDPNKRERVSITESEKIIAEIRQERIDKVRADAKAELIKAMDLSAELTKTEREFKKTMEKHRKELTNKINTLRSMIDNATGENHSDTSDEANSDTPAA